jgi:hypothetical protein
MGSLPESGITTEGSTQTTMEMDKTAKKFNFLGACLSKIIFLGGQVWHQGNC